MIFPVKKVREELVKEFAASAMTIDNFAETHSIKAETLKSWVDEMMHAAPSAEAKGESDVFSTNDLVRGAGIEIDVPIETCETNLFKILQTVASI